MSAFGCGRSGDRRRPCRNRPDTDFGSGGHITHPWPADPVDFNPLLRHGLKLVSWNMDWLADLYAEGADGAPALKPEDLQVRGPAPANRRDTAPTVGHRIRLFRRAIDDLDPDIMVVQEAPNSSAALQHFFDLMQHGEWLCRVQPSRYPERPDGPIREGRRCVGLAVRTDTARFDSDPVELFDAEAASNPLGAASASFFAERGEMIEWVRAETRPLYAEIRPQAGVPFRVLGVHLRRSGLPPSRDWLRWIREDEANRGTICALARRLREGFLDAYLADAATRRVPLVVLGGLNNGIGARVHDAGGQLCAAEILMGTPWAPERTLSNALFDEVGRAYSEPDAFADLWTMRLPDPWTPRVIHRAWVDHILYSRNAPDGWCAGASIPRATVGGLPFDTVSDHFPVTVRIDTTGVPPR